MKLFNRKKFRAVLSELLQEHPCLVVFFVCAYPLPCTSAVRDPARYPMHCSLLNHGVWGTIPVSQRNGTKRIYRGDSESGKEV